MIIFSVCPSPPTNIIEQSFFFSLFSLSQLVRLLLKLIVLTSFQDSPAYSEALEKRPSSHWIMGLAKNPVYAYFQVIKISLRDLLSWNTQTYETMSERPMKQLRQISMISLIRVKVMVSGTNIIRLTFLRNKLWNNGRWNVRSVTTNCQDENHAS